MKHIKNILIVCLTLSLFSCQPHNTRVNKIEQEIKNFPGHLVFVIDMDCITDEAIRNYYGVIYDSVTIEQRKGFRAVYVTDKKTFTKTQIYQLSKFSPPTTTLYTVK